MPQDLKDLGELLHPLIEMGLVQVTVACNGEVYYRMREDVTEEELLAALIAVEPEGGAPDA